MTIIMYLVTSLYLIHLSLRGDISLGGIIFIYCYDLCVLSLLHAAPLFAYLYKTRKIRFRRHKLLLYGLLLVLVCACIVFAGWYSLQYVSQSLIEFIWPTWVVLLSIFCGHLLSLISLRRKNIFEREDRLLSHLFTAVQYRLLPFFSLFGIVIVLAALDLYNVSISDDILLSAVVITFILVKFIVDVQLLRGAR